MARKKDGKSLFEVMGTGASRNDKSITVPSWFDRGGRASSASGPQADGSPTVPQPTSPPPVPSRREPILSVSAGRLVISLSQISAVVAALAIVLLVAAAYMLGRMTSQNTSTVPGRIKAPYNPAATRPGDGAVRVLPMPGAHRPGPSGAGMVRDDAKRQKGYSYLVIQGGIDTLKEAGNIKQFLYTKGVNATIHRMSIRKYMVKDMRGFRNIRSAQTRADIRNHVAQIERLGREYQRLGGRHGFKQSSSIGPWMETEK